VRGLDEIRRLAHAGVTRMLVILGASGSGKSSFLRAGLWSRLKRDDRAWLTLPIVRPERAALSGKYGLAEALYGIVSDRRFAEGFRQRGLPRSRADIQDSIEKMDDGLGKLLAALREIAQAELSGDNAAPPTILLAIDQGEELFNEEGQDEAKRLIDILTKTLAADLRAMAILVMRSDAFPLVQSDPALAALPKDTFTLDMMLEGSFRAVIEGPARLVEPPLAIDPQLTDALLEDISGQDALPLLAFTLAHLYDNTRVDNALTMGGYDRIGRVKGVIDKTVAQAFAEAAARGEAPKDKEEQLKLARSAFIPHLAQVNSAGQFVRRVAPREKIPDEARLLVDRFAEQRLLIRDRRQDAEVIEVAHEALLRQPPFSDWLAEDREFLMWRDRLTQSRTAFEADERGLLTGRELAIARGYLQIRAGRDFEAADLKFIRDSIVANDKRRAEEAEEQRSREAAEKEEQERRVRDAERIAQEQSKAAAAQKRTTRAVLVGLVVAVLVAAVAVWQYFDANQAKREAVAQREAADQAKNEAYEQRDRALKAESAAKEATAKAEASAEEARANLREAQIMQSRFLANQAWPNRNSGNAGTAVLLALEGLPDASTGNMRPNVIEAELQLEQALRNLRERIVLDHNSLVNLAFSPDGRRIVTVVPQPAGPRPNGDTARVWDMETGKPVGKPLIGHGGKITTAAFSPDGQRIVTASSDWTARLWDAATGDPIGKPIRGHNAAVVHAVFSPDGKRIVTASFDGTARLWDTETGKQIGEPMIGSDAAFSPDGTRVVTASLDQTARLWDAQTGKSMGQPLKGGSLTKAAFSPDGTRVVTASRLDKTVRLWDTETGKQIGEPMIGYDAAFSPDGKRIVTTSPYAGLPAALVTVTARLWDVATGEPIGKPISDEAVSTAAFSPDGKRIVTGSNEKTVRVRDAATGEPIGEPLRGHDSAVIHAVFSPGGGSIVTASYDQTVRVWDATATGRPIGALLSHGGPVTSAAFSPDGKRIVTASSDKTARLWDTETGKQIGEPFRGHEATVNSAAFSPDGKRIVTASSDKTARVWDAANGQPVGEPIRGTEGYELVGSCR
jgi:WD40 repeat protein